MEKVVGVTLGHDNHIDGPHGLYLFAKPLVASFSASRYPSSTFGEYIRKARLEKGLRQVDVAKTIGVDEMTIVNWEKEQVFPTRHLRKVKAVSQVLGLDCTRIVGSSGPPKPDKPGFDRTIRRVRVKRGLPQVQAAKLAEIDTATL